MARYVAVGAGRMGRSIAIACAWAGHPVTIVDLRRRSAQDWDRLREEALAEIAGSLRTLVEVDALRPEQVAPIVDRVALVAADDAAIALARAELVFEAVTETPDAKREALGALCAHVTDDAIVTSTTSSMLVTDLAPWVRRPARFLNIHWLNPAYLIPLVELSVHPGTDVDVVARARSLMEQIGKVPVVCGPTPGYVVPRLQALVMNEAARMIEEGAASAEEIDKATRFGLGFRFAALGVVEFIDFGGCDILYHASREMQRSIDPQRYAAPAIVERMVAGGKLGLKTASGFYDYAGKDLDAYRRDALRRILGQLRHAGLWRAPVA